jgi:hypothetical protein
LCANERDEIRLDLRVIAKGFGHEAAILDDRHRGNGVAQQLALLVLDRGGDCRQPIINSGRGGHLRR